VGSNKPTLLTEVVTSVNASQIAIAEVSAITTSTLEMIIKIKVSINNSAQLQNLMVNLRKVSEVYSVERDFK
jgi:GTP pyrophosphokinase